MIFRDPNAPMLSAPLNIGFVITRVNEFQMLMLGATTLACRVPSAEHRGAGAAGAAAYFQPLAPALSPSPGPHQLHSSI